MYVHYTNNNWRDLLILHIRLVRTFIAQTTTGVITNVPYKAGTYVYNMNNNRHVLLTLHIRLVRTYFLLFFSCIVQMDDTDDRAESLHRRLAENLIDCEWNEKHQNKQN